MMFKIPPPNGLYFALASYHGNKSRKLKVLKKKINFFFFFKVN